MQTVEIRKWKVYLIVDERRNTSVTKAELITLSIIFISYNNNINYDKKDKS